MGTVNVRFFAYIKEQVGKEEITLDIPDFFSLKQFFIALEEAIPSMKSIHHQTFRVAVNQELVGEEAWIRDGDEIALLPPFSGGSR